MTDYAALCAQVAGRPLGDLGEELGAAMAHELPAGAVDTPLRLAHFLAQASHETGGFHWLTELGGSTYFKKYDISGSPAKARELGNTKPGDGYRFRGRGIFQITGRANYARYGKLIGVDLVSDPDKASEPGIAVATAARYWTDHHLNVPADADDLEGVTRKINGGMNGLLDRRLALGRAKRALGLT